MNQNLKPKFEVHKLDGTAKKRVAKSRYRMDEDGNKELDDKNRPILLGGFDYEEVDVPAGWMVYFPSGSSIRVWTKEEMERQGFLRAPAMVDMETGDESAPMDTASLKDRSEQKSSRSRTSKSAQL